MVPPRIKRTAEHPSLHLTYPDEFFRQDTVSIAKALLGSCLVHQASDGLLVGRIVETEAYLREDPACHASRGKTARNAAMFGPPGTAYVYLIYGMYWCFNVVTAPDGVGEAVLIRALEPIIGLDHMRLHRGLPADSDSRMLCSGPGKLTLAMGITVAHNHCDLRSGPIKLYPNYPPEQASATRQLRPEEIMVSPRIGITKGAEMPLRFYVADNPFVSRRR